jgi:hypothetical protein
VAEAAQKAATPKRRRIKPTGEAAAEAAAK